MDQKRDLARGLLIPPRKELSNLGREDDAENAEHREHRDKHTENPPEQLHRGRFALLVQDLRKSGDECGREGAFRKQVAQEIGYSEGGDKGIGNGPCPKVKGDNLFADNAQDT
jgi:hypothetical protein